MADNTYFSTVFYPDDEDELRKISHVTRDEERTTNMLLLPHAGYQYISHMYRKAFSYVDFTSVERVIIIAPMHRKPFDTDSFMFIPKDSEIMGVRMDSTPAQGYQIQETDVYYREEFSPEIILPFIKYNRDVPVTPILADIDNPKKSRYLASFISRVDRPENLIIICSNATDYVPKKLADRQLEAFRELLEGSSPMFEAYRRKTISACGYGILDAVSKTEKKTDWDILDTDSFDDRGSNERCAYHLCAIRNSR